MTRSHLLIALMSLALVLVGCQSTPTPEPKPDPKPAATGEAPTRSKVAAEPATFRCPGCMGEKVAGVDDPTPMCCGLQMQPLDEPKK